MGFLFNYVGSGGKRSRIISLSAFFCLFLSYTRTRASRESKRISLNKSGHAEAASWKIILTLSLSHTLKSLIRASCIERRGGSGWVFSIAYTPTPFPHSSLSIARFSSFPFYHFCLFALFCFIFPLVRWLRFFVIDAVYYFIRFPLLLLLLLSRHLSSSSSFFSVFGIFLIWEKNCWKPSCLYKLIIDLALERIYYCYEKNLFSIKKIEDIRLNKENLCKRKFL